MMDDRYRSRKFALATSAFLVSSVALFMGHIGGGEFVAAVTVVLGLYNASNIMEKEMIKYVIIVGIVISFVAGLTTLSYKSGYDKAKEEARTAMIESEDKARVELTTIQNTLYATEKEYLDFEPEEKIVYEVKYKEVIKKVNTYVKDSNLAKCTIGSDGVQHVNELLKGSISKSE